MSASSIDYKLRPNKAVDRELFLSLLNWLGATLNIKTYKYISLGGPFLEDFRLVHIRTGINDMVSVEQDEMTHKRQDFNKPLESIECVWNKLDDYLNNTDFITPIVLWLDYTDPALLTEQFETFINQVLDLPVNSIVRITINANPTSLGEATASEKNASDYDEKKWRFERFNQKLSSYAASDLSSDDMTHKNFGKCLLKSLKLAVDRQFLSKTERKIEWALSTVYSDGQAMATTTLVIVPRDNTSIMKLLKEWPFYSNPLEPQVIDLPSLSTMERLTMERYEDPKQQMSYDLPKSHLKTDPFISFKKFYRVFPQFARIDL